MTVPDGVGVESVPSEVTLPGRVTRVLRADGHARTLGGVACRTAPPIYVERGVVFDWFQTIPGYREEIRRRVDAAARAAAPRWARIERAHADRDYLGRDPDGCG